MGSTLRGFKTFTSRCMKKEPGGNWCYYNIAPKPPVTDKLLGELQKYIDRKKIKYIIVVDNIEQTRPQRTAEEPEFYRPTGLRRYFSEVWFHNNMFLIAFWGKNWIREDDWDLDKILEGLSDVPEYSRVSILEGKR